jgi:hypothetical protein
VGLFFRPSVPLYHDFVHGRSEPYRAYLLAGPYADGYCFGLYDITVLVPFKAVIFDNLCPKTEYKAPHSFDCLSFYSEQNPTIQVACADTRFVRQGETFTFSSLDPEKKTCYDKDLERLLSV